MESRSVNASNGWNWIRDGFALVRLSPVIWIALFLIYLLIGVVLTFIPMVGSILLNLLAPVFIAGFMLGCRALENGEELEINHLFIGFKQNTSQLITVGGLYLAGVIVIAGITLIFTGGSFLTAMSAHQHDIEHAGAAAVAAGGGMLFAALFILAALVPLMMAYWFAPILVVFHDMQAKDAMKTSFDACMKNIMPFLVYSLISMGLIFLAAIPFGLGLFVLIPTMTASLYSSYKDIFNPPPVAGGEIAM
ncbi:MAG: hypothetical protein K8R50_02245 [Betaproteobacteria bacterium]|nr:hypothetical protein [Betaproteobacteria bacterium]